MNQRHHRNGFAMLMVLVFVALLMTTATVTQRHLASSLRVERAREQARIRDEGSLHALAEAVDLLETGLPPSSPYVASLTLTTSLGPQVYTITYQDQGGGDWDIQARPPLPGESPPTLPATFAQ